MDTVTRCKYAYATPQKLIESKVELREGLQEALAEEQEDLQIGIPRYIGVFQSVSFIIDAKNDEEGEEKAIRAFNGEVSQDSIARSILYTCYKKLDSLPPWLIHIGYDPLLTNHSIARTFFPDPFRRLSFSQVELLPNFSMKEYRSGEEIVIRAQEIGGDTSKYTALQNEFSLQSKILEKQRSTFGLTLQEYFYLDLCLAIEKKGYHPGRDLGKFF